MAVEAILPLNLKGGLFYTHNWSEYTNWMRYARVVRGITLSVRERDYIKAARLSGVSGPVIIFRHILPASLPSVMVLATIGLAKTILAISPLGFLGFGAHPPPRNGEPCSWKEKISVVLH